MNKTKLKLILALLVGQIIQAGHYERDFFMKNPPQLRKAWDKLQDYFTDFWNGNYRHLTKTLAQQAEEACPESCGLTKAAIQRLRIAVKDQQILNLRKWGEGQELRISSIGQNIVTEIFDNPDLLAEENISPAVLPDTAEQQVASLTAKLKQDITSNPMHLAFQMVLYEITQLSQKMQNVKSRISNLGKIPIAEMIHGIAENPINELAIRTIRYLLKQTTDDIKHINSASALEVHKKLLKSINKLKHAVDPEVRGDLETLYIEIADEIPLIKECEELQQKIDNKIIEYNDVIEETPSAKKIIEDARNILELVREYNRFVNLSKLGMMIYVDFGELGIMIDGNIPESYLLKNILYDFRQLPKPDLAKYVATKAFTRQRVEIEDIVNPELQKIANMKDALAKLNEAPADKEVIRACAEIYNKVRDNAVQAPSTTYGKVLNIGVEKTIQEVSSWEAPQGVQQPHVEQLDLGEAIQEIEQAPYQAYSDLSREDRKIQEKEHLSLLNAALKELMDALKQSNLGIFLIEGDQELNQIILSRSETIFKTPFKNYWKIAEKIAQKAFWYAWQRRKDYGSSRTFALSIEDLVNSRAKRMLLSMEHRDVGMVVKHFLENLRHLGLISMAREAVKPKSMILL